MLISLAFSFIFKTMGKVSANNLHLLLFTILLLVFASCGGEQPLQNIAAAVNSSFKESRLGESNYYVSIPDNYQINEARGKEGQLGYSIIPNDGESGAHGFIEIRRGYPIGVEPSKTAKTFATSKLAGNDVVWFYDQTETGYFNAFTNERGDLNAKASSKELSEVEVIISIIANLRQK